MVKVIALWCCLVGVPGVLVAQGAPRAVTVSVPQASAGGARIDEQALHRLQAAVEIMANATTLQAHTKTVSTRAPVRGYTGQSFPTTVEQTVRVMRPGYLWSEVRRSAWFYGDSAMRNTSATTVCTPAATLSYLGVDWAERYEPRYSRPCHRASDSEVLSAFFDSTGTELLHKSTWDTTGRTLDPLVRSLESVGREQWRGSTYDVVEWVYQRTYPMPQDTLIFRTRVFIDSANHIRRILTRDTRGNEVDQQVLSLVLNGPMSERDFAWTAPQGVTVQVSSAVAKPKKPDPFVGQQYATLDLTVPFLDGRKTTVRQYVKGKKGTLLWFWNTSCLSCMEEFPHMEQIYQTLRGRGIEIVVLDILEDEGDQARTYTAFHKATMPVVLSTAVTQTLETMRTSFVVLDSTGTIVYTSPRPQYLTLWRILNAFADGTDPAPIIAQANAAEEEQ